MQFTPAFYGEEGPAPGGALKVHAEICCVPHKLWTELQGANEWLFTSFFWRNSKDVHTFCWPIQYLCQGKRQEILFFQKIESQNLKSGRTLGDRRCHITLCHCPRFQSWGRAGTTTHKQQTRLPVLLLASLSAALMEGGGLKGYPRDKRLQCPRFQHYHFQQSYLFSIQETPSIRNSHRPHCMPSDSLRVGRARGTAASLVLPYQALALTSLQSNQLGLQDSYLEMGKSGRERRCPSENCYKV